MVFKYIVSTFVWIPYVFLSYLRETNKQTNKVSEDKTKWYHLYVESKIARLIEQEVNGMVVAKG